MRARLTAAERREKILDAAGRAFARGGFAGTSTDVIAAEAGVSQPYVVRIFGTKADLFHEVFERAARAMLAVFEAELADPAIARGPDVWDRLGAAYTALIADRDVLMVLLQGFSAAAANPAIGAAARRCMSELYSLLTERTGCDPERAREFVANGMLLNALLAMDAPAHGGDDPALAALAACAFEHSCGTHLSRVADVRADMIPSRPRNP